MRRIFIHSLIYALVSWFWVVAPLLAYLGLRSELQPFISFEAWDIWKTLALGPIDADTRDASSGFIQNSLLFGEWLYGYLLVALAALTAGRAFRNKNHNRMHVVAYGLAVAVAVATIIFGGSTSSSNDEIGQEAINSEVPTTTSQVSQTPSVEIDNGWSAVFETNLADTVSSVLDGASHLLYGEQYASYVEWANRATEMQRLFGSAVGKIDYLLRIIDLEDRPQRELTLGESRLLGLRRTLKTAIDEVDKLSACSKTSRQDGDCQAELDRVFQLASKANETSLR